MKLQNKFLVLLAPAGILSGALILYLIQRATHEVIVGGVERSAAAIARAAALESGFAFAGRREKDLLPALQALQRREGAFYAAALDSDGTVLAHTTVTEKGRREADTATLAALAEDEPTTWLSTERGEPAIVVVAPVWTPRKSSAEEDFLMSGDARAGRGGRGGALKTAVPLASALETERRIVREISAIVIAIGGVAFGLVLVLVRGILAPIRGLLGGIASIGTGDYDVRVPVLSRDELGELAESFNAMSGQLARTTVSKEYVEGILENMRDFLLVTDRAGLIKTVNHAAAASLGADLVGEPLASVLTVADGFSGAPRAARDAEVALKGRGGRSIPALLSSAPLRDRDGIAQGWIVVAKDITDRKRDEEELVRAKVAAEASSRELEAFSYSVAHDLRAPLRAVDGFSQVLLEEYSAKLDAQGKDYLTRVRAGSRRMGQLIDDLLNLSRITRSVLKLDDVDLSEIAAEIAAELRRSDPKRRVEFAIQPGVVVRGDAALLRVALVNLLSNAWKYTGKKQDPARVEFGRKPDGAVFVKDDGAGFDMAFANKLFHPFSRLHSAAEFEGTGIGLATVARVVERHRGRVRGEGVPGRGANFEFTLWEKSA